MREFLIILSVAVFFIILALILAFCAFCAAFLSGRKNLTDLYFGLRGDDVSPRKKLSRSLIDELVKYEYEDVYITAFDGKRLFGRYYHVADGAPLQIHFHGYRGMAQRDFAGGALECFKRKHNLLLVDQRAHGKSEGRVITFGIKERFDCLFWAEYAERRFGKDTKILLYGISMGAATVLMASSLPMPSGVVGILADCPYSSPVDIICHVAANGKIPKFISRFAVTLGARVFGGFNINAASCVEAVKNTKIPIILIHGEADDFVPCDMSRKISQAGNNIRFITFKDAKHGVSYLVDREKYMNEVNGFLREVLSE